MFRDVQGCGIRSEPGSSGATWFATWVVPLSAWNLRQIRAEGIGCHLQFRV